MTPYTDRLKAGHYQDPDQPKTPRQSTTTANLQGITSGTTSSPATTTGTTVFKETEG